MITVMGATGNTGSRIAARLLAAGEPVRALGRSDGRLAGLRQSGAEVRAGDTADAGFLTEAFRGSEAVYVLLHVEPTVADFQAEQDRRGEAIARAVRDSGVRRVVALSSVGADRASGTGFIAGLHRQESRLRALGVDLLLIRPGSFFENFHATLEVIKHEGVHADTVEPHARIPMIAAEDIAEFAADAFLTRNWSGIVVRELLGERDLSYAEATAILGSALGKPELPYVRIPDEDMTGILLGAGFSQASAGLHVEMTRAFSDGTVSALETRDAANTTTTSFERFAGSLADTYREL